MFFPVLAILGKTIATTVIVETAKTIINDD